MKIAKNTPALPRNYSPLGENSLHQMMIYRAPNPLLISIWLSL